MDELLITSPKYFLCFYMAKFLITIHHLISPYVGLV